MQREFADPSEVSFAGGGGPRALCLVAWPLGIALASSTSPSPAASGVPPLVSAVVVDGLGVGTQSPAVGILLVPGGALGPSWPLSVQCLVCSLLCARGLLPQSTDT